MFTILINLNSFYFLIELFLFDPYILHKRIHKYLFRHKQFVCILNLEFQTILDISHLFFYNNLKKYFYL